MQQKPDTFRKTGETILKLKEKFFEENIGEKK